MEGRTRLIGWFTRLDIVIKGLVAQLKILAILLHLELVLIIIHPLFVLRSELRSVHRSIRKRVILFSSLEPLSIFQFCVYKINRIFLFLKSLLQFPNSSYEENPSRLKSNLLHDYTGIWESLWPPPWRPQFEASEVAWCNEMRRS